MPDPNRALIYALRPRVVFKYAGELLFISGLLISVRAIVAFLFQEWSVGLVTTACSALLAAGGWALARIRATQKVQQNEMLAITAAVFLIVAVVSAVPFCRDGVGIADALFESISGVTTTGLSTLPSVADRGFVFLFSRAWMQWMGGLGMIVVSLALIVPPRVAARTVVQSFDDESDTMGGARQFARIVTMAYSALTAVMIGALLLTGLSFRDALLHALAGVSTGGFAPHNDSLASYTYVQQFTIQLFSTFGALPLAGWYYMTQSKRRRLLFDGEFRLFGCMVALVGVTLFGILWWSADQSSVQAAKAASVFALSAQSTTGFAPSDTAALPSSAKAVIIGAMLTGGEFGSTAGGVKMIRLLMLLKAIQLFFDRIAAPRDAVLEVRYKGAVIAERTVVASAIVGALFMASCFAAWLPFLLAGYDPLDALFEVASALGTVGLSTGVTSENLSIWLKLILCAAMFLGRLEIVAWLVLLDPRSWFGKRMLAV